MTQINLKDFEWRWWSQHGEDGVLIKIFEEISIQHKRFVEIGAHFHEANCLRLMHHGKWSGVFFDLFHEFPPLGFYKYRVTAENINPLFEQLHSQADFPLNFGLLSIDVDGVDFYLWNALDPKWQPSVVIMECNPQWGLEDKIVVYDPNFRWDGSVYAGASALALYNLAQERRYSLVHIETSGVNMFFIRNDLLPPDAFQNVNDLEFYWNQIDFDKMNSYKDDVKNRPFETSDKMINRIIYNE